LEKFVERVARAFWRRLFGFLLIKSAVS